MNSHLIAELIELEERNPFNSSLHKGECFCEEDWTEYIVGRITELVVEVGKMRSRFLKEITRTTELIDPLVIRILKHGKPCLERIGTRNAIWFPIKDTIKLLEEQNLTEYIEVGDEFFHRKGTGSYCKVTGVSFKSTKHTQFI